MNRYKILFSIGRNSASGIFVYSLEKADFVYSNESFNIIFGLNNSNPEEYLESIKNLMDTEDPEYLKGLYKELMETGQLVDREFRLKSLENEIRHIKADIYVCDDDVIGFIKDITNDKEHENYIIEYTAKKDAFLDMITHNLSGPLVMSKDILSWLEQSVRKKNFDEMQSLVNLLQDSTKQCIEIIDDFLKEEHVESQTIYIRKTRFDIIAGIHAVLEKLKDMNPDKEFTLLTSLENVNLNTDNVKFFQIVHNVLSNSIKFTGKGGKIEISVEEEPDAFVIAVRDNGIGIPDELKQYIFERRTYAGRKGLKGEESNGMGLSIVKKLVDLLGGEIWFESEKGRGTAFFIRLKKD